MKPATNIALNRRTLLTGAASAALLPLVGMPKAGFAQDNVVKIGFLAPLTGAVAAWGKPGLDGCRIWADWVNEAGGIEVGGQSCKVELVSYDDEDDAGKARTGATQLIRENDVKFIMMLGGNSWPGVEEIAARQGMMVSTLLPSDLTPDTETLIAPCEVHPIYNVTGVDWLAANRPELKTAVVCAQDDALGKPSVATYLAAFEAAGIEMASPPLFFDPATTDFAPVMTQLLASNPDILCLDTCYADYVQPLCEQAFQQGYKGQIISCTLDFYQRIVERTSKEFMEGVVFQFPDFDDQALNDRRINFRRPNEFYAEYVKRYGASEWSAVSWEYSSILDLWADAAQRAGSVEPEAVMAAMKEGGTGKHAFGEARWWGKELFGIDNALVGDWPVVVIRDGKATIAEFRSIPDWWDKNSELLLKHMSDLGLLWSQRS